MLWDYIELFRKVYILWIIFVIFYLIFRLYLIIGGWNNENYEVGGEGINVVRCLVW